MLFFGTELEINESFFLQEAVGGRQVNLNTISVKIVPPRGHVSDLIVDRSRGRMANSSGKGKPSHVSTVC